MSLLVKGMDMPCACLACDFCNTAVDRPYCQRLMREVPKTTRPDWCPLGEVTTPHGRLIDADKLEVHNGWLRESEGYSTHITFVYSNAINLAPTVIEAEE